MSLLVWSYVPSRGGMMSLPVWSHVPSGGVWSVPGVMALHPPVNRQTRVKHHLPATSFAGGNNDSEGNCDLANILHRILHQPRIFSLHHKLFQISYPQSAQIRTRLSHKLILIFTATTQDGISSAAENTQQFQNQISSR